MAKLTLTDVYERVRERIAKTIHEEDETEIEFDQTLGKGLGFSPAGLFDLVGKISKDFAEEGINRKLLEHLAFSSKTKTVGDLAQRVFESLPDDAKTEEE